MDKLKRFLSNRYLWEIVVLFLLSLTPLLWYKSPQSLAVGHDLFFPLDPTANFLDRISLWSTRFVFGYNLVPDLGTLFLHSLDALVYSLGFSVSSTQKIIFIFWFFSIGLSAYYLAYVIGPKSTFFRIFASVFFMFNHFLLQAWFIAERTKFSIVIAAPLILAFFIQAIEGRMRVKTAIALSGITLFFFNGGGSPPLYGGFLLVIFTAFLYFFIRDKHFQSWRLAKRYIFLLSGFVFVFLLVNAYWILPLLGFAREHYQAAISKVGGVAGIGVWVDVISKNASIVNLVRLQGIPDWSANHPYANFFLTNPILIVSSFLLPFLAYTPVFWEKSIANRRYIIYFALLSLLAIPFVAGTHPPFGGMFRVLVDFVPGFTIFRSSFYKFAPALWLSFTFLIAYGLYFFTSLIEKRRFLAQSIKVGAVIAVLLYNFPYFTGTFFNWNPPYSTMVQVPQYIYDFRDYVNKESIHGKILFLPKLSEGWRTDIYTWNYWSFSSVPSLFINKEIVINDYSLYHDTQARILIDQFYSLFEKADPSWKSLNRHIGVRYAVLRNDFLTDADIFSTSPLSTYRSTLEKDFRFVRSFGQWDLYELKDMQYDPIFIATDPLVISSPETSVNEATQNFLLREMDANSVFLFAQNDTKPGVTNFTVAECEICNIPDYTKVSFQRPLVLPNSPLYVVRRYRERKKEQALTSNPVLLADFYLSQSVRKVSEIVALLDLQANEDLIIQTFREYRTLLEKIEKTVQRINKGAEYRDTLMKLNGMLSEEQYQFLEMLSNERFNTKNVFIEQVNPTVASLRKIYLRFVNDIPLFANKYERIFNLTVERSGFYELFIDKQITNGEAGIRVTIDNRETKRTIEKKGLFFTLGSSYLTKGKHRVKIVLPESLNIAPFTDAEVRFPRGEASCEEYQLEGFIPGEKLEISFHHHISGTDVVKPDVNVVQFGANNEIRKTDDLYFLSYSSSRAFADGIDITNETKRVILRFCSPAFIKPLDINLSIQGAEMYTAIFPTLVAKSIELPEKRIDDSVPDISVEKQSQTTYEIDVNNAKRPYYIIFPQRFDSGWQLIDDSGNTVRSHQRVNFFANGWYIENSEKKHFILRFEDRDRQKYFFAISFAGVFSLLIYIMYRFVRRPHEKN